MPQPPLGGRLYQCDDCKKPYFAYHSCKQSAAALQDVTATKTGGARLGFTSVLHTWGRQIQHHPHVHSIVPAAAFHPKHKTLHRPAKDDFLIHYRPLAERFRSLIYSALQKDHPEIYPLTPQQRYVLTPAKQWNVQLQHAGSGKTALRYLARYVQRSAFSAKRLIGYDPQGDVLLHWTSSATGKSAVMALHPHEFIRRWLLHVLPKGFTRIRHYGYLGSTAGAVLLYLRLVLGTPGKPVPQLPEPIPFTCQCCGGVLTFLREIKPIYLMRGPPLLQRT